MIIISIHQFYINNYITLKAVWQCFEIILTVLSIPPSDDGGSLVKTYFNSNNTAYVEELFLYDCLIYEHVPLCSHVCFYL